MIRIHRPIHILISFILGGVFIPFLFYGDNNLLIKATQNKKIELCHEIKNPVLSSNCYETLHSYKLNDCLKLKSKNCSKELNKLEELKKNSNLYKVISFGLLISFYLFIFIKLKYLEIRLQDKGTNK